MQTNTYGDISPRTAGFATRKLLERGQHLMVIERFGQMDPQSKKQTKVRKWRRYLSLPRATAPLAEGITPPGQRLNYTDITATLEQYGDLVTITDVVQDTHEDPVLDESSKLCGEQAAETVEVIRYNVLKAGTNVYYSGSATTRGTVNGTVTRGDLRRIVRGLHRNKCRKISEIIGATAKISTQPVEAAFFGLVHTDLVADLRNVPGFVPVSQYSDAMKALPGEVGTVEEIRFVASALFEPFEAAGTSSTTWLSGGSTVASAAAADVYPILIMGRDAFGLVPLQGSNAVEIGVVSPGKKTSDDPLGQKGFVSWKTYQATAILNQQWIARYEVACTATPT